MRHRISEPKVVMLAGGLMLVAVVGIAAFIIDGDVWIAVITLLAAAIISLAIVLDLRGVISDTGGNDAEAPVEVPPGRSIVMCTAAMTPDQVLDAIGATSGDGRSIMFVAPEGLGTGGLMVDQHDYDRALRAECHTVAELRKAGINAAGHVGDRNPEHAIVDALALFPAGNVVIVAHAAEVALYRRHVDVDSLKRRTGADVRVLEAINR